MEDDTHFAPALRSSKDEILSEHELVATQKLFGEIYGSMAGISAIINTNRQIVYSNKEFLDFIGLESLEPVLGKRFGETLACLHSLDMAAGCGTSLACAYCGAINAVLESQRTGLKSMRETRVSTSDSGNLKSLDLNIISTPVTLSGNQFYILSLQDISAEKRISAMERIFFHDLLNSAGGLNGLLTLLKEGTDPEEERELISLSEEACRDIIEEIILHRQILAAESGELEVKIERTNSLELLHSAVDRITFHEAGQNRHIIIDDHSANVDFETDRILFQRVIINLLKNALEATEFSGSVIASVVNNDDKVKFLIKNSEVIAKDVQMQIFQRSFSTKGPNRGIGTYSIRLLTENYLKGKVSFVSNEKQRTIFTVELNKIFPAAKS